MCGIFLFLQKSACENPIDLSRVQALFTTLKKRGPDKSSFLLKENFVIGFHRLAINGLSENAQQPFFDSKDNFLICNGEIYNHKYLEEKYNVKVKSGSDCECLLPLFRDHGITNVLSEIDGVFAIICRIDNIFYFIRDRIGVRPLFYGENSDCIIFASEPCALEYDISTNIQELLPGSMATIENVDFADIKSSKYYYIPKTINGDRDEKLIINKVREKLISSIKKRMMSDREVGCLLSGGLDSSIVASVLSREYKLSGKKLKTFSIGFSDSTDLVYARKLAKFIDSDHHEFIVDHKTAIDAIPSVIRDIGTYDITTIRASTMMWLLCQKISKSFKEKVLFSGEGSDEIFSGYLYFHLAPDNKSLEDESRSLVENLYKYDVLRADRCISSHGLELREPFLDIDLINYYLRLSGEFRRPKENYEKWILRKAFEDYLPSEITWRIKQAFSDAVSSMEKPWYKYIQEYTDRLFNATDFKNKGFPTTEAYYYHKCFMNFYLIYKPIIEYWMPKWTKTQDPSATTLEIYSKKDNHSPSKIQP